MSGQEISPTHATPLVQCGPAPVPNTIGQTQNPYI